MAYAKTSASAVPKREVKRGFRFEATPEWAAMKVDLDRGLKAKEALQITFSDEEKLKYNIKNRRTIVRFVQAYLTANNLPYQLRSFRRSDLDFVVVTLNG